MKNMKKNFLFSLLLVPGVIFAQNNTLFDNKTWYLDGKTLLTSRHDPLPLFDQVYDYSVKYETPNGLKGKSKLCKLSSATALSCYTGEGVSSHPEDFSATLSGSGMGGPYTYYEKDHQPSVSPITGNWHREKEPGYECNESMIGGLTIPSHSKEARKFDNIRITYSFDSGYSEGNTFYLVQDEQKNFALSESLDHFYPTSIIYLYDKNNLPISDFNKLNTVIKLNDGKNGFNPACNLLRT